MLRFVLSVDKDWTVTCDTPGVPPRYLVKTDDGSGGILPTLDPTLHAAEPPQGLLALPGDKIKDVYDRLMDRSFQPQHPALFGQYLFDVLLGASWGALQQIAADRKQWFIELALSWPAADAGLSRLPWELMRGASGYLSTGYLRDSRLVEVAITRLVPGSDTAPRQIRGVPRVLFAVGASISDETLRPAAEIMCLVKRTNEKQRRMHARMVENCTPSRIRAAVESFRPDVVHIISHGNIDPATRKPFLELRAETSDTTEQVEPAQLAAVLQTGGHFPPLVVLSACLSGSAMLGPEGVGPFAAQLVSEGVPIVVGMSGSITDTACRLFTRRFAEAVLGAEPLVAATAEGRRAAFAEGKAPETSIDWAYPAVFLSIGVPPGFRPADAAAPPDLTEDQIRAYAIPEHPIFCGRQEFFEAVEKLFQPAGPAVLAAYTADSKRKYGRTRLLEELAAQAILEGHIPCLVSARNWTEIPNTPFKLALAIDYALGTAVEAFDLSLPAFLPARRLQDFLQKNRPADYFKDDDRMQRELIGSSGSDIPAGAAFLAIEQTCTTLMEAARSAHPEQFRPDSRVVVLLDDVEQFDTALTSLLIRPSLPYAGLGTKKNPVPLILTFALQSFASTVLDPLVQNKSSKPGWIILELRPFKKNGENLLAYQRVLLNPFNTSLLPGVSDRQLVMDYGVDQQIRDDSVANYNDLLDGVPEEFSEPRGLFYAIARMAKQRKFLREAGDDDWLKAQQLERRRYGEDN